MVSAVFRRLPAFLDQYGIERRGVLHVGGHKGEEGEVYRACGFESITWIEPNPDTEIAVGDVLRVAIGTQPGRRALHVTESTKASSLLEPLDRDSEPVTVPVMRLDSIDTDANVLVVDVQGAELDVLRSDDLSRFDMVVVETRSIPRYRGQAKPKEVHERLTAAEFRRVAKVPHRNPAIVDHVYVR